MCRLPLQRSLKHETRDQNWCVHYGTIMNGKASASRHDAARWVKACGATGVSIRTEEFSPWQTDSNELYIVITEPQSRMGHWIMEAFLMFLLEPLGSLYFVHLGQEPVWRPKQYQSADRESYELHDISFKILTVKIIFCAFFWWKCVHTSHKILFYMIVKSEKST